MKNNKLVLKYNKDLNVRGTLLTPKKLARLL